MHPTARFFRFIPLALALAVAGGCAIGQLIGGMAASAEREGSHKVAAKYTGLRNRTFAVFIAADRTLQSEFPQVVPAFTREITRRLSENAGAAGVLPADDVLQFQFRRPGWTAMSQEDIAKELEVDRLVFIELNDFTLNDPGNRYEWRGVASGTIRVVENNESRFKLAFNEPVRVAYPDSEGQSIDTIAAQTVLSELSRRFCERSAWAFYDHEEANILKY